MLLHIHCIALHTVRYNDRNNILSVYTLENGRMSLLVSAGRSKESRRRKAMMMPMSLFECVADIRPGREIVSVDDVRPTVVFPLLHSHPVKIAVAMFMSEFLNVVLRESQPDPLLFRFICASIDQLDRAEERGTANFLMVFMYRLTRFLGIEPDVGAYHAGAVFDMADGIFRDAVPLHGHYLDSVDSRMLKTLSRMSWENMSRLKFNRHQRRRVIAVALEYYTMHFASLSNINSPVVLSQLFD